jgi:hypothetical protein
LYNITNSTLFDLLSPSGDRNPSIQDRQFPDEEKQCDMSATDPEIKVNG